MKVSDEVRHDAARVHAEAIVVAAHSDICPDVAKRRAAGARRVMAERHIPGLIAGGVTVVCDHVAGDTPYLVEFPFRNTNAANKLKWAMQALEAMHREVEESPTELMIATTVEQIRTAKRDGKVAVVLSFEGAGPIEDAVELLGTFWRLGVRCIGLTHDFRNHLADGVRTGSDGGLTELGREAVREMNRLGIVADVSHLNDAGFWDVVKHSGAPIHASHSNARSLCSHPRNLTDEQLLAIAASGGVVGVHALGALVTDREGEPTLDEFLAHVDRLVEVMGEDHVGLGPDIMENYPADEYRLLWDPRLPTAKLRYTYPPEFASLSQAQNLTAAFLARGYGESVVRKILGGNMLRLFETTWEQPRRAA